MIKAETSYDAQMELPQSVASLQQRAVASHFSQCFRKSFSQKLSGEAGNSNKNPLNFSPQLSDLPVQDSCVHKTFPNKEAVATGPPSPVEFSSPAHLPLSCPSATPMKNTTSADDQDFCSLETPDVQVTPAKLASTPAKLASTPARLMAATPSLQPPPKRCLMSPDDSLTNSPKKLVRRPARSRSLKFDTPLKAEKNEKESLPVDDDILEILPENLLQSVCPAQTLDYCILTRNIWVFSGSFLRILRHY